MMRSLQCALAAALLAAAGAAPAQWMWVDAKGLKQVSDRPPPASIPAKNILRAPMNAVVEDPAAKEAEAAAQEALASAAPAPAPTKGLTLAEREADYRKRQADKAVQDKKLADAAAASDSKANACRAAQENKAKLDSGIRIRNGAGRSEFMSDKERADNMKETARFLAANCQ
ncbi:DUF4124 domain-containing protein [Massilia sp. PAMC28688]|uniref:DUF4124 domain-containing protein n=1 Tax=Massilia sp. PAMC28688 TaxID=2861283 RepID=UPI001C62B89C|nr:DUF4124 domain-containing protein [Massilia sp. PAMC28688]QYF92918.1 DUF4124 domain-containing protein [Massilia sp. PAMC28688]